MNTISSGQNYAAYTTRSGNIFPANTSSPNDTPSKASVGITQGISISDAIAIDQSHFKLTLDVDVKYSQLLPPESPQQYLSNLIQQGEVRQTAVIKENGKIIGSISEAGMTFFSNSAGSAVYNAGLSNSSLESIQDLLNTQSGGGITIEKFAPGEGPSYAEVHNSLYSKPYDSLVKQQTAEYIREHGNTFIDTTA